MLKTSITISYRWQLGRKYATSIIAKEVEKMKGKDNFKYSLKHSEKVKMLPMKISLKISSKSEATFVSDL